MGHYRIRPQHELFLREYIRNGSNAAQAYRTVYPNSAHSSGGPSAARLMARDDLKARYEILLERHMRRNDITVEKILGDYQDAIDQAKRLEKPGDVVNAATAQAKLVGLLRERLETGNVGDFDNMADVSQVLEAVEKEAGPEAALALAKVFNIDKQPEQDSALANAEAPTKTVN